MPTPRFDLCWQHYRMALGARTRIMGILNVTPDSFSDGGRFFHKDQALAHAEKMIAQGADIIDVGGESSRPFSDPVTSDEEVRRVLPIIEHLAKQVAVPLSIDTTKADVARRAVDAGASIINDISSLRADPKIGAIAASHDVLLILMHMKGTPKTMQVAPAYDDLMSEIHGFFADAISRAVSFGVDLSRIIIDPGKLLAIICGLSAKCIVLMIYMCRFSSDLPARPLSARFWQSMEGMSRCRTISAF
jgi:dihydropteroate synthase